MKKIFGIFFLFFIIQPSISYSQNQDKVQRSLKIVANKILKKTKKNTDFGYSLYEKRYDFDIVKTNSLITPLDGKVIFYRKAFLEKNSEIGQEISASFSLYQNEYPYLLENEKAIYGAAVYTINERYFVSDLEAVVVDFSYQDNQWVCKGSDEGVNERDLANYRKLIDRIEVVDSIESDKERIGGDDYRHIHDEIRNRKLLLFSKIEMLNLSNRKAFKDIEGSLLCDLVNTKNQRP